MDKRNQKLFSSINTIMYNTMERTYLQLKSIYCSMVFSSSVLVAVVSPRIDDKNEN